MTNPLPHNNSIDFTNEIGKQLPPSGVYASECGGHPSFYEYKYIDSIRSMVQEQMKGHHFPKMGLQEPLESFYKTIGTTFVKQMTIHHIVDELIKTHPELVNLEPSDPNVAKAIYDSFDSKAVIWAMRTDNES